MSGYGHAPIGDYKDSEDDIINRSQGHSDDYKRAAFAQSSNKLKLQKHSSNNVDNALGNSSLPPSCNRVRSTYAADKSSNYTDLTDFLGASDTFRISQSQRDRTRRMHLQNSQWGEHPIL